MERPARAHEAGPGRDAGEVRHLVQLHRLQPGRRARARLQGRLGARHATAAPRWARGCTRRCSRSPRPRSACRCRRCGWPRRAPTRCPTPRRPRRARAPTSTVPRSRTPASRCSGGSATWPAPGSASTRPPSASRDGTVTADGRGGVGALGRPRQPGLLPARPALGSRFLPHRGTALGQHGDARLAVQVLRLRRCRDRGRGRRLHRRVPHAPGRHRPRRRRQPLPARRPRPGRGRLRAGRGLADPGGPALGRGRRADAGRLATQAASTYKLPSFSEMPEVFHVALLERAHEDGAVYGSKAVGEPPLMLAFSVREALREAAAAFGPPGICVDLASPATPEAVWWALDGARRRPGARSRERGRTRRRPRPAGRRRPAPAAALGAGGPAARAGG